MDALLPTDIICSRTEDVAKQDYDAVLCGVSQSLREQGLGLTLVDHGLFHPGVEQYGRPQWYVTQARTSQNRGLGEQIDVLKLTRLLRSAPLQHTRPYVDLFVTGQDLTSTGPTSPLVFAGYCSSESMVLSTARFSLRFLSQTPARRQAIEAFGARAFAQMHDLAQRDSLEGTYVSL
jgi:hypothetical protein